jgi:anti-sigma B factor antagonist
VAAHLQVTREPETMVFRVAGELDMSSTGDLIEAIEHASTEDGDLFLDLSELQFIDSMGIHVLIQISQSRTGHGCLVLSAPSPAVTKVFELVRLSTFPNVHVETGAAEPPPAS